MLWCGGLRPACFGSKEGLQAQGAEAPDQGQGSGDGGRADQGDELKEQKSLTGDRGTQAG